MSKIISGISFPAIKGTQSGQEYYIVMCPLKRLKQIFTFDESILALEEKAQRPLNYTRIPQIVQYIQNNRYDYSFSSLTACIEGEVSFEPVSKSSQGSKIGTLFVDESAEFYLTDGQHRSEAIRQALEYDDSLRDEHISVVFFVNKNLKQRQKIFRDLNLYPVPTSKSIAILYGNTPEEKLSNKVATESSFFNGVIEFSDTRLSKRSTKLFMHSSLHSACIELCKDITEENWAQRAEEAILYWDELAKNLPLWWQAKKHLIKPIDKANYIIFTAILLKAFALLGKEIVHISSWKKILTGLQDINWSRSDKQWSERCCSKGRIDYSANSTMLTLNALKHHLNLPLTADQLKVEQKFRGLTSE